MNFKETGIKDLVVIEPSVFPDDRGYFFEGFKSDLFAKYGFDLNYIQDNVARSCKGVLRGMHLQKDPYAQAKIIRCLQGSVYDVAVDLRPDSPTYKKWYGIELTADNNLQLLVPRGFGHGYLVLSDSADVMYKVDNRWHRESEAGFMYNDPEIGIDWPKLDVPVLLSPKDEILPTVADLMNEMS